MLMRMLMAMALLIASGLGGAIAADEARLYTTDRAFADVMQDLKDAIINKGLVIDFHGRLGEMLSRTRDDVGSEKEIYRNAEFYAFCSATLSRKMMEADPENIRFCPYVVFAYESASGAGTVHVGYRRPLGTESNESKAALEAVDRLLDDIVREAAE